MANTIYESGKKLLCGDYSSYTPTGKGYFSLKGRVGKTPNFGSVVYFYSSSLKRVSHVGIVSKVSVKSGKYIIQTIEGNTAAGKLFERDGGEVAEKQYTFSLNDVGGSNTINCFCSPVFEDDTCTAEEFVTAARKWLQYVEKESDGTTEQLMDKFWNPGDENYTYFGKWYGMNPAQWCQMFVSYCAYDACKTHKENKKTGWIKEDKQWFYYINGKPVKNQWIEISGRWYAMAGDGHAITDSWFLSDEQWYYLGEDSAMLSSQWLKKDDQWYYLTSSGAMAVNTYTYDDIMKKFCYMNDEGVWDRKYVDWELINPTIDIVK